MCVCMCVHVCSGKQLLAFQIVFTHLRTCSHICISTYRTHSATKVAKHCYQCNQSCQTQLSVQPKLLNIVVSATKVVKHSFPFTHRSPQSSVHSCQDVFTHGNVFTHLHQQASVTGTVFLSNLFSLTLNCIECIIVYTINTT